MRPIAPVLIMVALTGSCLKCDSAPSSFPRVRGADPNDVCAQGLISIPPPSIAFAFDDVHGHHLCVPGSDDCSDDCTIDLGDVPVGTTASLDVTISVADDAGFGSNAQLIFDGAAKDEWYAEGEPSDFVLAKRPEVISLALRPLVAGDCGIKLDVMSDATNLADFLALPVHATCVDDADAGPAPCNVDGACCCASGEASGDASCDSATDRVVCASGFLAFDDACAVSPCAP